MPKNTKAWRRVDRRSIRTVKVRGGSILVGCPRGHWHPQKRRGRKCDVGTFLVEKRTHSRRRRSR